MEWGRGVVVSWGGEKACQNEAKQRAILACTKYN